MTLDFLATKKSARQALHETLAVSSLHKSKVTGAETPCRVRVHTKVMLAGDVDYQGYAELSDGAVIIHFTIQEARALNVAQGDVIVYDNETYVLNTRKDHDSVYIEPWYAIHKDR